MAQKTLSAWLRGRTMVLNQIAQEHMLNGILKQLAYAVAERNYGPAPRPPFGRRVDYPPHSWRVDGHCYLEFYIHYYSSKLITLD